MEGHAGFCNHGQAEWGADVLDFFRSSGMGPAVTEEARDR
jgi:hypothetical protein